MAIKTSDDYTKAIKRQYEIAKGGVYGSYLSTPSPAQLRNLCLVVFDKGLAKQDLDVFMNFFEVTDQTAIRRGISKFDVEKLKPIQNFLLGKNATTNQHNLNLIAILVGFEPRPLHHFLKSDSHPDANLQPPNGETDDKRTNERIPKRGKKVYPITIVLLVCGILLLGYTAVKAFLPKPECMQWQIDHYEEVACEVNNLVSASDIEPFDAKKVDMKKISVTGKTVFFKNDIPQVWYVSRNGSYEYFNCGGVHPISGKALRPMTWYMINKHVLKSELK